MRKEVIDITNDFCAHFDREMELTDRLDGISDMTEQELAYFQGRLLDHPHTKRSRGMLEAMAGKSLDEMLGQADESR